jgi:hypothetical protein
VWSCAHEGALGYYSLADLKRFAVDLAPPSRCILTNGAEVALSLLVRPDAFGRARINGLEIILDGRVHKQHRKTFRHFPPHAMPEFRLPP